MRDVRRRLPWVVAIGGSSLLTITLFLAARNGSISNDPTSIVLAVLMMAGYATVGTLIASRRAGGPIGWLMIGLGAGFLVSVGLGEYAVYAYRTEPGGLPLGIVAAWVPGWSFIPTTVTVVFIVLLFPTGRVPTPRWRPVVPAIVALTLVEVVATIVRPAILDVGEGIHVMNPTGVRSLAGVAAVLQTVAGMGLIASAIAAVVALVLRLRRSHGEERQQIRWLSYVAALGGAFFVVGLVSQLVTADEGSTVGNVSFLIFFACAGWGIPAAAGAAILRYRLWDLDVVVRKTVVFALVAGTITMLAVVLVIVVPVAVLGTGLTGWERGLLAAGVGLGLLVTPLRRWARRVADRLVYGGRATPYEVLTEFSGRLAETYSTDDVVPRMAAIVGSGTGARRVTIWLRVGRDLRPVASWPEHGVTTDEGASWFEVRHQGEALGAVTVSMPANDPMTTTKERLVHDLAAQAGLVLRNVRLIEELRESRRRIVTAQDERARKLERNIHDGAQQQLVALAVKIRLADSIVERDAAKAHELLGQVQTEAQDALETLRDLARGIYPPLLADKGLTAALRAQGAKTPVAVEVTSHGAGRYAEDVEAAVYFCALEALQNATKYANASRVRISLTETNGDLRFEIADDGAGFDPDVVERGSGLAGMTDRIEAIGGRLRIASAPGAGARIEGAVPVPRTVGGGEIDAERSDQPAPAPVAASQADSRRSGPNTDLGM